MIHFHSGEIIRDETGNKIAVASRDLDFKTRLSPCMFAECDLDLTRFDERMPLTRAIVRRISLSAP